MNGYAFLGGADALAQIIGSHVVADEPPLSCKTSVPALVGKSLLRPISAVVSVRGGDGLWVGLASAWPNASRTRNTVLLKADDFVEAIARMASHLNEWQHTRFAKAPQSDIRPLPSVL